MAVNSTQSSGNAKKTIWRALGYLRPYWRLTAGASYRAARHHRPLGGDPSVHREDHRRQYRARELCAPDAGSVFGLLALALGHAILTFFQGKWTETASQGVAYDLRNALHRKLAAPLVRLSRPTRDRPVALARHPGRGPRPLPDRPRHPAAGGGVVAAAVGTAIVLSG